MPGMRAFCMLLFFTAAVFQVASRSSSETRILPDGTSEHHIILHHQPITGVLRMDQHTQVELRHAAVQLDIGLVRAAYGPMRGTEALQRAASPALTALRSLAGSDDALPRIDLRRSAAATPQYMLGIDWRNTSFTAAGFAAARLTEPTAADLAALIMGIDVSWRDLAFAGVLQRSPIELPNMLSQDYYVDQRIPGLGAGVSSHALLRHSWDRGVNMAGLHTAYLPAARIQTGVWLYQRLRYGNTRMELRVNSDSAGYKLHSRRFESARTSLTAKATRFSNNSIFSLIGYLDNREHTAYLRMTASQPLSIPGVWLLFGSQLKGDGTAQLSPGLRWENRWSDSLVRAGIGSRLDSPSLRRRSGMYVVYSWRNIRLEYDAAWDSYLPGAEQKLQAVFRLEHASLTIAVGWNSLELGGEVEGVVQAFAPQDASHAASRQ